MPFSKRRLLPPFGWLVCITWLSTQGGVPLPGFHLISADKLAHATAYGLLCCLLLMVFPRYNHRIGFFTWLFASLYGATMEWVQFTWFPNRHFEFDDMLANSIGAFIAWMVIIAWKR